jgi:hypothetical protein
MSGIKKESIRSQHPYQIARRAKRKGISIEELLEAEAEAYNLYKDGKFFCTSCDTWKDISDRPKNGWYCKECYIARSKELYNLDKQRARMLKKKYGITPEKYDEMLSEQDYRCYICHKHEDKLDRSLAVDHCHKTGKVRGLLCGNCNRFLGQIDDNINTAERLLEYLQKHKDIQENG